MTPLTPHRSTSDVRWDLSGTGNLFVPNAKLCALVAGVASIVDFTTKGSPDAAPVRQSLAATLRVPDDWISVGAGSASVIDAVLRYFRDRTIVDVVPNFHLAWTVAERDGRQRVPLAIRHTAELLPAIRGTRLCDQECIIILSSPQSVFGHVFTRAQIADVLRSTRWIVIVDEAYVDFGRTNLLSLARGSDRVLIVRTLSKAWGVADLRIGFVVAQCLGDAFRRRFLLPYAVGALQQLVAIHLLQQPAIIAQSVAALRNHRQRFIRGLRRVPSAVVWPSSANFVFLEHPHVERWATALRQCGIITTAAHELRTFPPEWPSGMRIAVPPPHVQDRIVAVGRDITRKWGRTDGTI